MKIITVQVNTTSWYVNEKDGWEGKWSLLASGVFEDGQTVINCQKVKSDSFTALVLLLVEAELNGDI